MKSATSATPTWVRDLAAVTVYAIAAFYLTAELWASPSNRVAATNVEDYELFQWFMAHAAHAALYSENPLFTHAMNAPDGVNMMANTSMLAIAIPLIPITLLFGAHTSIVLAFTASYFLTAAAWYWLFSRHIVTHRGAAFTAAAFCGFSPAMVTHGCGQPNLVAQFMIPFLIWATLRLREPGGRAIARNGVILGLLVVVQAFINEEVLFLTALALAVFCASYAIMRPREVRTYLGTFVAGLGVAALTSLALLAYPLWFQFYGPQSYRGVPEFFNIYTIPINAYVAFPRQSILGNAHQAAQVTVSACEENTLYGWPLVIFLGLSIIWMLRSAVVRALTITAVVYIALSFGDVMRLGDLTIDGPWTFLKQVPLFEAVTPIRFGLLTTVIAGVILALSLDKAAQATAGRVTTRWLPYAVAAAVLIPLVPRPLPADTKQVPEFITSGVWRDYIPRGTSMVTVPLPSRNQAALRWSARADTDYDLASGYFLGPDGITGRGHVGPPPRPTEQLFLAAADGKSVEVNDALKAQTLRDLRYWRASVIALDENHPRQEQLRAMITELLALPPQHIGGLWIWDVRAI